MISRAHRFHGHNSLRYAYQHGKAARGPLFLVKAALNPRRRGYRVAVVVSRKVHKSAVGRNRIRRRLYAAVRNQEGRISQPYDIVFTVFDASVLQASANKLAEQVERQLRYAGVIANQSSTKE